MNEEIKDDALHKVTSVGNAWIVCKSKSHQGHVYYFNTLTGEAVWNLSKSEIERAKNRTKYLECLPGAKPTRCPEPRDEPPSKVLNNVKEALKPFDNLIVKKTVTDQQGPSSVLVIPNFVNNSANFCSPQQMSGVLQSNLITNLPSGPVCSLNSLQNSISSFNLNTTAIYNPKVWTVPQTQQMFMAPMINPGPTTLHVAYNNLSQAVSQPAIVTNTTRTFCPRDFNYGQSEQRKVNKTFINSNTKDLRQKLSFKSRFNKSFNNSRGASIKPMNQRKTDVCAQNSSSFEARHSNNETMDNLCEDTQLQDTPSKINVGPLKCLAPSNCNSEAWFIVVDLDVLLKEFKFLTTLTDSDEKCHLMIPKRVMEDLKTYVNGTDDIQAKRILRFLSHQVDIGYAFIDALYMRVLFHDLAEEPSVSEGSSMADVLLATCTQLLEYNYHLILLTNDNDLLTNKNTSNIKVFSIEEVKKLLRDTSNKQSVPSDSKKQYQIDEVINKIKIVVPNNTKTSVDKHTDDVPPIQPKPKENSIQDKINEPTTPKRTVDAGIQTDFEDINSSFNKANEPEEKQNVITISNNPSQSHKEDVISEQSSDLNARKREIKLNRATSNEPIVIFQESRKQFKWRRRRNTSHQENKQNLPNNEQNTTPQNVKPPAKIKLNRDIIKKSDTSFNNDLTEQPRVSDDSIESRESSISIDMRNSTLKENITIEETSTSGIISNTESNVDAESNYSTFTPNKEQLVHDQQSQDQSMYEIESITMEEYLKTKCDEWISRFIQIMEEVLSQVLQLDPPFEHSAMPPPWTLHEAAQCIALKFYDYQDIKDAANKLSITLFRLSDTKGKITMNMSPCQYMQMYSHGVNLLTTIMNVTGNCEDIQIALESLKKLLDDIRNPNMDTNDTFATHEIMSNNGVSACSDINDESAVQEELSSECDQVLEEACKTNLEKDPEPVKFIRNININSMNLSLSLHKKNVANNDVTEINKLDKSQEEPNVCDFEKGHNSQNNHVSTENDTDSDVPKKQPNIVRKFSICPEFEKKLKSHNHQSVDMDSLDYDEYLTDEYCSEDENYDMQHNDSSINNIDDTGADCISGSNEPTSPTTVLSLPNDDSNKKFKYMMCMFLKEIKEAFCQVKVLFDEYHKELKSPHSLPEQKLQLRQKAEVARLNTIRLCKSLESMLDHETKHPGQNICKLLKLADINFGNVDDKLLLEYRMTISRCKENANEFLDTIQNIMSEFSN